jgi:hypothetical protein
MRIHCALIAGMSRLAGLGTRAVCRLKGHATSMTGRTPVPLSRGRLFRAAIDPSRESSRIFSLEGLTDFLASHQHVQVETWHLLLLAAGRRIRYLPPDERRPALRHLLRMADRPAVPYPRGVVHSLARQLQYVPGADRSEALRLIGVTATRLMPDEALPVFDTLIFNLPGLPTSQCLPAFHGLLLNLRSLGGGHRSAALASMSAAVAGLPSCDRPTALRAVLRDALLMPAQHRAACLLHVIGAVPTMTSDRQPAWFYALLVAALTLPADRRATALQVLAGCIHTLRQPGTAVSTLCAAALRLPAAQRDRLLREMDTCQSPADRKFSAQAQAASEASLLAAL